MVPLVYTVFRNNFRALPNSKDYKENSSKAFKGFIDHVCKMLYQNKVIISEKLSKEYILNYGK